ncbi:hypothetical protein BurJ1DRAFT_0563 [Burkholderiales bacterium JOSHI_001]|nr:hypothetical protein BurJ1DRAFT_0563 [Burkholderiales bacterium JOSHI_001]
MSCCGSKREQLKAQARARAAAQSAEGQAPQETVRLCYRSGIAVVVLGPATGTPYSFPPNRAGLPVDPDDALLMLDSGRFERV